MDASSVIIIIILHIHTGCAEENRIRINSVLWPIHGQADVERRCSGRGRFAVEGRKRNTRDRASEEENSLEART